MSDSSKKDYVQLVLGNALGLAALATLAITNLGVIFRYGFQYSMPWNEELVKFIFVWMIFVGFALSYHTGGLAGIMFLEEGLKKRGKLCAYKLVKIVQALVSLAFGLFCTYAGWDIVMFQFETEEITTVLEIPLYLITSGLTFGFALFSLYVLGDLIKAIKAQGFAE